MNYGILETLSFELNLSGLYLFAHSLNVSHEIIAILRNFEFYVYRSIINQKVAQAKDGDITYLLAQENYGFFGISNGIIDRMSLIKVMNAEIID
jgi:hypothetical protein